MTMTTKNSKDSNVLIIFENFFIGEYKLQHSRQLGEPCQRGAQLPVLWKNFLLEGSPGETHRDAPQGWNNDIFRDFVYELKGLFTIFCLSFKSHISSVPLIG